MRPALTTFALLCIACAAGAEDLADDEVRRGAELYADFACYSCHGYHGTGMTPLVAETSGVLSSRELFLTYLRLRTEQNPVNPSRDMPSYSATTLSDEQARAIYRYIVSFDDDPPALEDIPALAEILESAEKRTYGNAETK